MNASEMMKNRIKKSSIRKDGLGRTIANKIGRPVQPLSGVSDKVTQFNNDANENKPLVKQEKVEVRKRRLANGVTKTELITRPLKKQKKVLFAVKKKTLKPTTVGEAAIAFVIPLLPALKAGLETKGVNVKKMNPSQIMQQYYNLILVPKDSSLKPLSDNDFSEHELFSTNYDSFDSDNLFGLPSLKKIVSVGKSIVKGVKNSVSVVKGVIAVVKNGGSLPNAPATDVAVAKEAEKIMAELEKKKQADEVVTAGQMSQTTKYILFGVGGLVLVGLIIYFARK